MERVEAAVEKETETERAARWCETETNLVWNGSLQAARDAYKAASQVSHHDVENWEAMELFLAARVDWLVALLAQESGPLVDAAMASLSHVESLVRQILQRSKPGTAASVLSWFSGSKASAEPTPISDNLQLCLTVILADIDLFTALLLLRQSHWVRGGILLRKAWKRHEALCARLPLLTRTLAACEGKDMPVPTSQLLPAIQELVDQLQALPPIQRIAHAAVLFSAGAFLFFVSLVPPSFAWMVEAIGFHGNRAQGAVLLHIVSLLRCPAAPLAQLVLIWIYTFFYDQPETAMSLLTHVESSVPRAAPFLFLGGYLVRKEGNLHDAQQYFHRALAVASLQGLDQLTLSCTYEIGWCLYLEERWQDAAKWLQSYLDAATAHGSAAFASYQLAVCLYFSNAPVPAVRSALEGVFKHVRPHFSWDVFAERRARQYLEALGHHAPMLTPTQRQLLLCSIRVESRRFAQAEAALSLIQANELESDDAAAYYYYRALILKKKAAAPVDQLIAIFEHVVQTGSVKSVKHSTWVVPHALTELGDLAISAENWELSSSYLSQARQLSGYDFEKPVQRRIARYIDRLKVKMRQKDSQARPS